MAINIDVSLPMIPVKRGTASYGKAFVCNINKFLIQEKLAID